MDNSSDGTASQWSHSNYCLENQFQERLAEIEKGEFYLKKVNRKMYRRFVCLKEDRGRLTCGHDVIGGLSR